MPPIAIPYDRAAAVAYAHRWAYGRKWRPERMVKSTIRLPAKLVAGEYVPDWDAMEQYIKDLPYNKTI